MRSKTSEWFECKVQYEKVMEDGYVKKVTELYTVEALSFTEAEARIIEEMSLYINGEYEVKDIKKSKYKDILFSYDKNDDRFYQAKIQFITLDEKTKKEKRSNFVCLVQAATLNGAIKGIDEVMGGTMSGYDSVEAKETKILDVIEYVVKNKKEAV